MRKISFLYFLFTVLSYILLLRDRFTLEVISTKFYPQLADFFVKTEGWKLNIWPTVLFFFILIFLFLFYFHSLKLNLSPKKIIFVSLIFQIIVFFSYPILSTDVLNYILSDRVSVVYHRNVWITKPNEFTDDPYYYLVYPIYKERDWNNQTRIYGGTNQFFYTLPTALAGNDLVANIVSHKLVVFIFNLASIFLMFKILQKYFPEKLSFGLMALFWNPLFILETVGSGHNDILMLFFLLLSYLFVLRKNFILVGIALGLSTQVKSTSLLFAVFLILSLISQTQWKSFFKLLFSYAFVTLGIYRLMEVSPLTTVTRTAYSTAALWQSLPFLIPWAKPLLNVFLMIFLIFQTLKQLFFRENTIKIYCQTLLVYLMFFLGAYWNWYPIWILIFVPFLSSKLLQNAILAFTFTSMLTYPALWFSYRFSYPSVIIYLLMISGPITVFTYDRFFKKI